MIIFDYMTCTLAHTVYLISEKRTQRQKEENAGATEQKAGKTMHIYITNVLLFLNKCTVFKKGSALHS